jgi:ceramide glucosyltransferase
MYLAFVNGLAIGSAVLTGAGLAQALTGWFEFRRFIAKPPIAAGALPAVTILKPLHGDEPLLEEALASFCAQDYPTLQIIFGLQDPADPALPVVRRLRDRFPNVEVDIVVSSTTHGLNRKISNLINMLPLARHEVVLIADSDMHVPNQHVSRVMEVLQQPGIGLVTSLYSGRAAYHCVAGLLGASHINHSFTPGALVGRLLGRRDCLGATMALRRETLEAVGGFDALANHLADDALLGRLVGELGLRVTLAPTIPATTVPELSIAELFAHELRWARTVRFVAPVGYAFAAVQYAFVWATLAIVTSGLATWSLALMSVVWALRYVVSLDIDRALKLSYLTPAWILPVRDFLSAAVMIASYTGTRVAWRGHVLTSKMHPVLHPAASKFAPGEG